MRYFWAAVQVIKWIAVWILFVACLSAIAEATEKPTPNPCITDPNGDVNCPEPPDPEWQVP